MQLLQELSALGRTTVPVVREEAHDSTHDDTKLICTGAQGTWGGTVVCTPSTKPSACDIMHKGVLPTMQRCMQRTAAACV